MKFNKVKDWFLKHFGTLFNVLGFIATIYFGVWYIPKWLKETRAEEIRTVENEIIQTVKEIVFNDSTLVVEELESLIQAKEIKTDQPFPLTISEVLTKSEESFMEDRFLPYEKRIDLLKEIEIIKRKLPVETNTASEQAKASQKGVLWYSLISVITAIITVIAGVISSFFKHKIQKDTEEEINNELEQDLFDNDNKIKAHDVFEKNIINFIKYKVGEDNINFKNKPFLDAEFLFDNKKYFIEAKHFLKSKVGLRSFIQFANYLKDQKGEGWLIYNTDLTPLVEKKINEFNNINKDIKIKAIRVPDSKEFETILDKYLNQGKDNLK